MIHKKLEKLRKEHKLSRSKLAEEIGVATLTLTNWECKRSSPKPKDLINLCKFFNITLNDLLGVESWQPVSEPPTEWGYYLCRKKGSRQSQVAVFDTNQFLTEPVDEWAVIPKI